MLNAIPFRKIYVSRARQKVRRLANEEEILPVLAKYGFQTVFFEEMTFEEQVALMQETVVLMGVHGANLTNMLLLPKGAKVVELLNQDKIEQTNNFHFENLIFYRMAVGQELLYYCLPCQTVGSGIPTKDSDIRIGIEKLESLLPTI